jgi:hypothetical protein
MWYSWMAPYNMSSASEESRKPMALPAQHTVISAGVSVQQAAINTHRIMGKQCTGPLQNVPERKAVANAGAMPRRASTAVRTLPYVPICSAPPTHLVSKQDCKQQIASLGAAHHHAEVAADDGRELRTVYAHSAASAHEQTTAGQTFAGAPRRARRMSR